MPSREQANSQDSAATSKSPVYPSHWLFAKIVEESFLNGKRKDAQSLSRFALILAGEPHPLDMDDFLRAVSVSSIGHACYLMQQHLIDMGHLGFDETHMRMFREYARLQAE